ncbi:Oidioi.mRNA.OKI2018_I69.PAR.g8698.t1.cds [Oikopleura dioica]|uniref:Oidioi.mRNA.OKI2018_I69.PAR.g8698.t1.cds n=1 Tax=Oikopleura dioica TaxID=34765 RepID=A0ABN7RHA1_OIKDI|nr:Oidioi.mRNA.OKI2018_I69.PAR.g8698.t1.cds [Oikopleura dioica]
MASTSEDKRTKNAQRKARYRQRKKIIENLQKEFQKALKLYDGEDTFMKFEIHVPSARRPRDRFFGWEIRRSGVEAFPPKKDAKKVPELVPILSETLSKNVPLKPSFKIRDGKVSDLNQSIVSPPNPTKSGTVTHLVPIVQSNGSTSRRTGEWRSRLVIENSNSDVKINPLQTSKNDTSAQAVKIEADSKERPASSTSVAVSPKLLVTPEDRKASSSKIKVGETMTDEMKNLLEESFAEKNLPTKNTVLSICSKTGLQEQVVWSWFRVRRRVARMESGKHELPNMSTFSESESSEQESVKIEVKEDDDDVLECKGEVKPEILSDQEDDQRFSKANWQLDDQMDE